MENIKKHVVTQEDLDNNTAFASTGTKVGDVIEAGDIEEVQEADKQADKMIKEQEDADFLEKNQDIVEEISIEEVK